MFLLRKSVPPKKKVVQILQIYKAWLLQDVCNDTKRTWNFLTISARRKKCQYGLKKCNIADIVTSRDEPLRKRVTGGIIAISLKRDMVELEGAQCW